MIRQRKLLQTIYSPSINLEEPIEPHDASLSDIFKDNTHQESDANSLADFEVIPDNNRGSTCSKAAAEAMTTNAFVSNVSWSSLVLPWENDFMSQIFSESLTPDPKLVTAKPLECSSCHSQFEQAGFECPFRPS